jgi:hypothetical protein
MSAKTFNNSTPSTSRSLISVVTLECILFVRTGLWRFSREEF